MAYYISSGVISSGIVLYNDSMYISSGGTANSTTVNNYGDMYISAGGTANSTTVNNYGDMYISAGGTANSTTVNAGGYMYISSGGTANSTTVIPMGGMYIDRGGTANNTVNSGGYMYISSGGTANSTTMSGGYMFISSGGTANNTTVNYGGSMYIYSGGTACGNTINTSGTLKVENGGVISNTAISSGAVINGLTLLESNYCSSGLHISNAITSSINPVYLYDKQTAEKIQITRSGNIIVSSGAVIKDVTISGYNTSQGHLQIASGGIASNAEILANGKMSIASGASGLNLDWTPSIGTLNIASGAYVTFANEIKGVYIGDGKTLSSHTLTVENLTLNGNILGGGMFVMDSGTANNTTLGNYARVYVYSGGIIKNTGTDNLNTHTQYIYVYSGGIASNTNVPAALHLSEGAIHRGTLKGGTVNADNNAVIDFSVHERKNTDSYLINDLAKISGTPNYTITVADNQACGTYKLAQGAANFNSTLTIGNGTVDFGTITVNGKDFVYKSKVYSLDNVNGNLTLSIAAGDTTPPEAPVAEVDTTLPAQQVLITVTYSEDSAVKQYKIGNGEWQNYTQDLTITENVTLYFRAKDEAGNISDITEYEVSNIDRNSPHLSADYLRVLHGCEIISVDFDDAVVREYSFDGSTWHAYSGELQILENTTVQFRGIDIADNIGSISAQITDITGGSNIIDTPVAWYNVNRVGNTVTSTGTLTVSYGGRASNTLLHPAGEILISSGGSANTTHILSGGKMFVNSGGKANYTTIHSGGYAYNRGGSMFGVTIKNGGRAYVSQGAVADTLYISQGGNAYVWSGGTAKNAYTQSFGCLYVYDGGVASSTKLMTNGNMYIYSGGKAFDTVTSFGVKIHMFGGSMNNLNMQRGTIVSAYKGAIVTNATVDYGSYLLLGFDGNNCTGVASATNTNVLGGGGLTVITGAKATGITLAVNGTLTCNNDGTIGGMITNAGRMNLAGNAIIDAGTNINFNLSGRSASAMVESYKEAMLNSYYVARDANMSITVSADQSAGDYILANWAGSANGKSIALTVGSTAIDDLSTDASIIYKGKKYSLYCFDDATNSKALTLKIENLSADSLMENPDTLPDLSLPELPEASGASELTAESLCTDSCAPTIAAAPTLDDLFAKTTTQLPLLAV